PGCLENGSDFGWVVAIVIKDENAIPRTSELKSPLHAAERGQRLLDHVVRNARLCCYGNRCQSIEGIVLPRQGNTPAADAPRAAANPLSALRVEDRAKPVEAYVA